MKDKLVIELVIVLILAGFGLWTLKNSSAPVVDNIVNDQEVTPTEDLSDGSINTTIPAKTISYADALIKYKDARIQLGENCQASPNSVTYKNGTSLMIDNRASVTRAVKVGSTFSVKAWGFKIVKLSSATLPVTWYVDCGTSQNVATILIQK